MAAVAVVGGGVIGLTTALELARAGHEVRCVRDRPVDRTVSAVAGGLWFPYHVEPRDRVLTWGLRSLARFTRLALDGSTGVREVEGLVVHRSRPDRWWTVGLSQWRPARPEEVPPGALTGTVARLPLVEMPTFLRWLESVCRAAGVTLETGQVQCLDEVDAEVVVVAAGLDSTSLDRSVSLTPGRGQVVRVENPGLDRWYVDDEHPDGLTYVLPHPSFVVCGGTDVAGRHDDRPDPDAEHAILDRCRRAVPALQGAAVVGRAVGLRPLAPRVSLDRRTDPGGRTVVTNYGHGGAGVTLSWGCAEEVVSLLGT